MTGLLEALNLAKQVRGLADDLHTSDEERQEIALKSQALENTITLAQLEISKAEAQHGSWFVAGARPAGLWCGPVLILYNAMLVPVVNLFGVPLAPASNEVLMTALGLSGWNGGARTIEKLNGVARSRIR